MDISIDGWIDGFNLNMAMFPLVNQRDFSTYFSIHQVKLLSLISLKYSSLKLYAVV